jgi:hypothetical protein
MVTWAPLNVAGAIGWMGHGIIVTIQGANRDRREDHEAMMDVLTDIVRDLSNLEGAVDGLARRYDPPNLSD